MCNCNQYRTSGLGREATLREVERGAPVVRRTNVPPSQVRVSGSDSAVRTSSPSRTTVATPPPTPPIATRVNPLIIPVVENSAIRSGNNTITRSSSVVATNPVNTPAPVSTRPSGADTSVRSSQNSVPATNNSTRITESGTRTGTTNSNPAPSTQNTGDPNTRVPGSGIVRQGNIPTPAPAPTPVPTPTPNPAQPGTDIPTGNGNNTGQGNNAIDDPYYLDPYTGLPSDESPFPGYGSNPVLQTAVGEDRPSTTPSLDTGNDINKPADPNAKIPFKVSKEGGVLFGLLIGGLILGRMFGKSKNKPVRAKI